MQNRSLLFCLLAVSALSQPAPSFAADGVKIDNVTVATTIPDAQRDSTMEAVRAFYGFWDTGDETLLKQAIAESFTDRTLPAGRRQGPDGPAFASRNFRAAVPDLRVELEKVILAGNYVTVHMKFSGRFTGVFGQTAGKGQPIAFIATDLVKMKTAASPTTGISKTISRCFRKWASSKSIRSHGRKRHTIRRD